MQEKKLLSSACQHILPVRGRTRQCQATQCNTPTASRGTESPTQVNFSEIVY